MIQKKTETAIVQYSIDDSPPDGRTENSCENKTEVHKIETAIVQYSIDGMTDSRRNMHAKTTVHKIETAIVQYSIDTAIVIAVTRSSTFSVAP
jgi:hypothetical protein